MLANATGARWTDGGPAVEMSAFGGKLITESAFTAGRGIITVRPNAVDRGRPRRGAVEVTAVADAPVPPQAAVRVVERVAEEAAAVSIEEARIIVAGGRGVGGPDGFELVEDLAEALGGAVGATRAAVDSGWIPYSQQIGQTGKIVKPQLYLALGISGAIQHKVGMQTAGDDRRGQSRSRRADRRVRRPVRRRRPVRGRAGAPRGAPGPTRLSAGPGPATWTRSSSCRSWRSSPSRQGSRSCSGGRGGSSRGRASSSASGSRSVTSRPGRRLARGCRRAGSTRSATTS